MRYSIIIASCLLAAVLLAPQAQAKERIRKPKHFTVTQLQLQSSPLPWLKSKLPRLKSKLPRLKSKLPRLKSSLPRLKNKLPRLSDELPRLSNKLPRLGTPRVAGARL